MFNEMEPGMGMPRRWAKIRRLPAIVLMAATIGMLCLIARAGSDAVLDAKRDAAAKVAKEGKYGDAITLLDEVASADGTRYQDFLQLARYHEKLTHQREAIANYRKALSLIVGGQKDRMDAQARAECEKRIKVLDAAGAKIEATVQDLIARVDVLGREASASNNPEAIERVFRLKGALLRCEGGPNVGFTEVLPIAGYQSSGFMVSAGQKYHILARGKWRPLASQDRMCGAAGVNDGKGAANPPGILMGVFPNGGGGPLGEERTFTAPVNGEITFYMQGATEKSYDPKLGMVYVLIERVAN